MCSNILRFLCFGIVSLKSIETSKYDINAEAHKLYGEDLMGALQRFRKTYDYMKILEERIYILNADYVDALIYLKLHYAPIMEKKVEEVLGIKSDVEKSGGGERNKKILRNSDEDSTKTDVQILDEYINSRVLSVHESISFVNLGFEFAGKVIHDLIMSMGGTIDAEGLSTVGMGDNTKKPEELTTHPREHIVTNEFMSTARPEGGGNPEKFKFRANSLPKEVTKEPKFDN